MSNIIDLGFDYRRTEKDKDRVIAAMNEVYNQYLKLKDLRPVFNSGFSDISAFKQATEQLKKVQDSLTAANGKYVKTLQDMAKEQATYAKIARDAAREEIENAKAKNASADAGIRKNKAAQAELKTEQEAIKSLKLQQQYEAQLTKEKDRLAAKQIKEEKNTQRLKNEYEQLKIKYNEAAAEAKRLGVALGTNDPKFIAAAATAMNYYKQLDAVEVAVGQTQRRVGQYERAQFSLNQVLREAPAFTNSLQTGFLAISNNLPILVDEFSALKASVGSSSQAFGIMLKGLFSWQTAILAGITLLTIFGKEIGDYVSSLFKEKDALDGLSDSQKQVVDDSAAMLLRFKEMSAALKDSNIPLEDRRTIVKKMREEYGPYLKNMTDEEILLGNLNSAYMQIVESIKAKVAIQAAQDEILPLLKQQIALTREEANLQAAVKIGQSISKEEADKAAAAGIQLGKATIAQGKSAGTVLEKNTKAANELESKINKIIDSYIGLIGKTKEFTDTESTKDKQNSFDDSEITARYNIQKTILQSQAEFLKKQSEDDKLGYDERLTYATGYYQKLKEITQAEYQFQISLAKAKGEKLTSGERDLLLLNRNEEFFKLQKEYSDKVLQLQEIEYRKSIEAQDEALRKMQENEKEAYEARKRNKEEDINRLERAENFSLAINAANYNKEQAGLLRLFNTGKINRIQYEKSLAEITKKYSRIALEYSLEAAKAQLLLLNSNSQEWAELKQKISETELALEKLKNPQADENKSPLKYLLEDLEKAQQYAQLLTNTATNINSIFYNNKKAQIEETENAEQEAYEKNVKRITDSTLSEEEKANRLQVIEAQRQTQQERNERRQRELDVKKAKFDRDISILNIILNTARGVTAALTSTPPNIPLSIGIGIEGASQLAVALATKIPRYKEGLSGNKESHFGVYGEAGNEIVRKPGQPAFMATRETLDWLPKGTEIIPVGKVADNSFDLQMAYWGRLEKRNTTTSGGTTKPDFDYRRFAKGLRPKVVLNIHNHGDFNSYVKRQIHGG